MKILLVYLYTNESTSGSDDRSRAHLRASAYPPISSNLMNRLLHTTFKLLDRIRSEISPLSVPVPVRGHDLCGIGCPYCALDRKTKDHIMCGIWTH